jgi:tetratricopeptide (TPR) repeat protein
MRSRSINGIGVALALGATGCIPDDPVVAGAPSDAGTAARRDDPAATNGDPSAGIDSKSLMATLDAKKDQLKGKPRDFSIDIALGNLYYENARYIDAIEYYTDALDRGAPAEKRIVALTAAERSAKTPPPERCQLAGPSAAEVPGGAKGHTFEAIVTASDELTSHGPDAAACLRQLIPSLALAHARRGNSWYLIGNADKAQVDHAAALVLDPDDPEALFFSGALVLETSQGDPAKLAEGRAFWEHLLRVAPTHPRADLVRETLPRIDQLFGPHAAAMAGHPPVADNGATAPALPPGLPEAMGKVQHTPEMDANLDKTTADGEALLEKGQWQEALDTFKTVMPLRPSGRIALDMGIALRELGKPTAERVLTQATRMPGGDTVRAQLELGILYEKTNPAQARAAFEPLVNDPKWGEQAKAHLQKLANQP